MVSFLSVFDECTGRPRECRDADCRQSGHLALEKAGDCGEREGHSRQAVGPREVHVDGVVARPVGVVARERRAERATEDRERSAVSDCGYCSVTPSCVHGRTSSRSGI